MRIRYLSYGKYKTGGYRYEKTLFDALKIHYGYQGTVESALLRKERYFRNVFSWISLTVWAYLKSNADINIVSSRCALPAIWRNRNNQKQVWIVLHNYDDRDGKSSVLKSYFRKLFRTLIKKNSKRFKVICVAPFWVRYFRKELNLPHVYLFPNLFNISFYEQFQTRHKNAWIHLGQYSTKNDPYILKLAYMLSQKGYYCFFCTLDKGDEISNNGIFDILYFEEYREYLEHVSRSLCTLALTRINEGWNRVAHESILVGTPVIGYGKGGLGDLLKESDSIIVNNIDEAYTCITESLYVLPKESFNMKYDVTRSDIYLESLCRD